MTLEAHASKIATISAFFWISKIIATTLGETAGDFIAQTLDLGYVVGLSVTSAFLLAVLVAEIRSDAYRPALFWTSIVATTTAGTEISDLMDRTLGFGYLLGSVVLFAGLLLSLAVWYLRDGTLRVQPILKKDTEAMFWIAVIFSNSLGTAFGDALVDVAGLGYMGGALVTSAAIGLVLILHAFTRVNDVLLFWAAFVFTRPFGATFGDLLTKPVAKGGLDLGTLNATLVATALLAIIVFVSSRGFPRSAAQEQGIGSET